MSFQRTIKAKRVVHEWPAPAAEPVPLTLDAAWKEAEAVLPKGWSLLIGDERKYGKSGWWATGSEPYDEAKHGFKIVSSSDKAVLYATPAEALQALAALLGAIPVDTQEGTDDEPVSVHSDD